MASVETVRGPVELANLGRTLVHEHLFVLGAHIADFKIPQYVAVSAAPLPRNPGGKLLKRQLRDDTDWAAAIRR